MNISDKPSSLKDKRSDIRHNCSIVTELFVDDRVYPGYIRNKSRGGICIEARGKFSSGQKVTVSFTTPVGLDQKKTGKIVRIYPDGIGVKFDWPGYSR
jgi:hypothetical protein